MLEKVEMSYNYRSRPELKTGVLTWKVRPCLFPQVGTWCADYLVLGYKGGALRFLPFERPAAQYVVGLQGVWYIS